MSTSVRSSAPARCLPLSMSPCLGAVRVLALSTLFFLPVLDAQEPAPTPTAPSAGSGWVLPEQRKGLSASAEIAAGSSLWGPVSEIQGAMWEGGLDDPGDGGFLGSQTVSYPRIHDFPERVAVWIAGRQGRSGGRWTVGFGGGVTGLGSVEGHRAGPGTGDGVYVTVQSSVFTVAPMLWLEAALTLPARKPFYFLLLGQYRWLADTSVVVPQTGGPPRSVPIPLSHAFVAIGFGFRF